MRCRSWIPSVEVVVLDVDHGLSVGVVVDIYHGLLLLKLSSMLMVSLPTVLSSISIMDSFY